MPAFLVGALAVKAYKLLAIYTVISILMLLIPVMLSRIPGMEGIMMTSTGFSWNVLSPLSNVLQQAPQPLRWNVWYSHADTGLVIGLSIMVYRLYTKMFLAAAAA